MCKLPGKRGLQMFTAKQKTGENRSLVGKCRRFTVLSAFLLAAFVFILRGGSGIAYASGSNDGDTLPGGAALTKGSTSECTVEGCTYCVGTDEIGECGWFSIYEDDEYLCTYRYETNNTIPEGSVITLVPYSFFYYRFVGWYDGKPGDGGQLISSAEEYEFTVKKDTTIYAIYETFPEITKYQSSITTTVGNTVEFHVEAEGKGPLTYQWQYMAPNSTEWVNSKQEGAKTDTIRIKTKIYHNDYQYRCVVTDAYGGWDVTNPYPIDLRPMITRNPNDATVEVGETAVFTVAAYGKGPLQYQWRYRTPDAEPWDWRDSTQPGANTPTLTVQATVNHYGYRYMCTVTDCNGRWNFCNSVELIVTPKIKKQPVSKTVSVGDVAVFSVTPIGKGPVSYQWQYKSPGSQEWSNSTQSGAKTSKLSVSTNVYHNNYQYRCVVTDACGNCVTSEAATLTVLPKIITQPANKSVTVGTKITLSVEVNGKATLKYQWQYKAPGSTTWTNSERSGAKTAKLTIKTVAAHDGYQYRCVVTDGNSKKVYSKAATLTVK